MKEYKILLVDDHEIIINGIMNALLPWPHFKIVEHVKNGLEVYNACCAYEPDILILDLSLPGINGLDNFFVRRLREGYCVTRVCPSSPTKPF